MPKSSKKKKDKAADFSKAKLKLGKGKQTPSNVVDTSFKARSIALPTQSIATDRDSDAPTTKRRLTFDALIAHLKHYNASTRRVVDAILGLRELLEAHHELINSHLTALVNSCVRIIGDEDASVRKALLSFFAWLFRQVPRDDIIPHSSVLLLFATSAQTHIFPEIRIDAVRFLDVFLEYIPDVVTEGWTLSGSGSHGRRVLEGYLGILNAGTTFGEGGDTGPVQATSTASVVLSAASKLVVLRSLATFLNYAVSITGQTSDSAGGTHSATLITPTWYFSSSFASTSAFHAFDTLLQPIRSQSTSSTRPDEVRTWHAEHSDETEEDFVGDFNLAQPSSMAWTIQDLDSVHAAIVALSADSQSSVDGLDPQHIARTLHPTLVSTFLDCAPTVFSPSTSPPETELQMVLVVCRICRSLYGRILQDTAESGRTHGTAETDLQTMLSYLTPYFPFVINGQSAARRDIKIEQAFQDLNLIFCELSSFLVLASQVDNKRPAMQRSKNRSTRSGRHVPSGDSSPAISARQIERVSQYIMQLLRGEVPTAGVQSIPRPITPQAYTSLLPTVWSLINGHHTDATESSEQLFSAIVEHAMKASSTSAVKRHTIDFLGRLTLLDLEPEYLGSFRCGQNQDKDAKLREWILQLPKTMWELGGNHLSTTETIVRILLRLSQRRSRLLDQATQSSLKSRLVPYFSIEHPSRGIVRGPYAKLPAGSPLRRLVLDLVATIQGHTPGKTALGTAVFDAVRETPEESYIARVVG
ncbi:hypothetical protein C8Q73DRAFT_640798 [Cubamyces lactineus]|nr:hypothetical protein C8Q73DRAFT_640798 [Cubamyces lactineus]